VIKKATERMNLDSDVIKALNQVNGIIKDIAVKGVGFIIRRDKPWIANDTLDLADE
jgi:hypothetical protein